MIELIINVNKCYFDKVEDVLICVVFMGIGLIMKGKKMILMVYGEVKVEVIKGMIDGLVIIDMLVSVL